MDIQDEISMLTPRTVEEAYQLALKAEDKIARRQSNRGRGPNRGRGQKFNGGRFTNQIEGTSGSSHQKHQEGDSSGRQFSPRGRGHGRGREFKFYKCGKMGHRSFECPENNSTNSRSAIVVPTVEGETNVQEVENIPETGESLLLKKVLLKSEKEASKPAQRKTLFKTMCKVKGKCC